MPNARAWAVAVEACRWTSSSKVLPRCSRGSVRADIARHLQPRARGGHPDTFLHGHAAVVATVHGPTASSAGLLVVSGCLRCRFGGGHRKGAAQGVDGEGD